MSEDIRKMIDKVKNFKQFVNENSNMKEVPYEGIDVDKQGLRDSILELVYELCPEYRPEGYGNQSPW